MENGSYYRTFCEFKKGEKRPTHSCALQCIWFRATTIRMSGAVQVKVLRLQARTTVLCLPSLKLERCE